MTDFFERQAAALRRTRLLVGCYVVSVVAVVAMISYGLAFISALLDALLNQNCSNWDLRWFPGFPAILLAGTAATTLYLGYKYPNASRRKDLIVGGCLATLASGLFFYGARIAPNSTYFPDLAAAPVDVDTKSIGLFASGILVIIASGCLYRRYTLLEGGHSVAALLGARRIGPSPTAFAERTLRNVVDEMAIASGVPTPSVYILGRARDINCFVAGYGPSDTVLVVTRGTLVRLTRDEIQAVIAHEFSHILNGDMRLNLRLVSLLHGIFMIAMTGRGMLHTLRLLKGRKGKGAAYVAGFLMLSGVLCLCVGFLGYHLGRLLQAAICRQRELLADASAVQFTRNPVGLAGALEKISAQPHPRASDTRTAQFAHLFFSEAPVGKSGILATHPSPGRRLRAIEQATAGPDQDAHPSGETLRAPLASAGTITAQNLVHARQILDAIPARLATAARTPSTAPSIVFALLLSNLPPVRTRQQAILTARLGRPAAERIASLSNNIISTQARLRLPLLNLALPALRTLETAEIAALIETSHLLIAADGKIALFEFMLVKAIERHVAAPARNPGRLFMDVVRQQPYCRLPKPPPASRRTLFRPRFLGAFTQEFSVLLSALARAGSASADETARAFAAATARIPKLRGKLQLLNTEACTIEAISAALDKLAQSSPAIRKVLLLAGTEAVAADGTVEPDEADLLRAVADSLDCPLPPLLGVAV
jgi:Zn-dependent protease with chaperone function